MASDTGARPASSAPQRLSVLAQHLQPSGVCGTGRPECLYSLLPSQGCSHPATCACLRRLCLGPPTYPHLAPALSARSQPRCRLSPGSTAYLKHPRGGRDFPSVLHRGSLPTSGARCAGPGQSAHARGESYQEARPGVHGKEPTSGVRKRELRVLATGSQHRPQVPQQSATECKACARQGLQLCSFAAHFGPCLQEAKVAPVIAGYWERAEFPHELVSSFGKLNLAGGGIRGYGCPVSRDKKLRSLPFASETARGFVGVCRSAHTQTRRGMHVLGCPTHRCPCRLVCRLVRTCVCVSQNISIMGAAMGTIEIARVDASMSTFLLVHSYLAMLTIGLLVSVGAASSTACSCLVQS